MIIENQHSEVVALQRQNEELQKAATYYKKLSDELSGYNILVDAEVILLKRDLEQKKEGNSILLGLHDLIGSNVDLDTFFNSTLDLILTTLKMDKGVVLWKMTSLEKYEIRWHRGYGIEEAAHLKDQQVECSNVTSFEKSKILINKNTTLKGYQEELRTVLLLPFMVGVPIKIENEMKGWLIAGREKEAYPFYPPLLPGNLETFQLICGFIEATVSNTQLYQKLEKANKNLEEYNKALEKKVQLRTKDIEISRLELEEEKKKADELLLNILPAGIAEELKRYGSSKAKRYSSVTILFTDFVNFSQFAEKLTPEELVAELDKCFRAFDEIVTHYGIEKIKTIGDAYMCTGGLPTPDVKPHQVINAALDMVDFIRAYSEQRHRRFKSVLQIRIGIHHGPVIAGVVGMKKFSFDIWGDTVNTSSRMESSSEANRVNVSGAVYELTKDDFNFEYRGKISIKNKGEIDMYFVDRK